jgi:hypothetical protein
MVQQILYHIQEGMSCLKTMGDKSSYFAANLVYSR